VTPVRELRSVRGMVRMLGLLAVGVALAGTANAASTVCGTIITNVATATMTSGFPDFVGYEVSYNASCTVVVLCPPVVALRKYANGGFLTEGAAGATVTFQICIENQTNDTVWGVTVSDQIPNNMAYVDAVGPSFDFTVPNLGAPLFGSASTAAGLATMGGAPTTGQGAPYFLRWTYNGIGPAKSACSVYRAKIL